MHAFIVKLENRPGSLADLAEALGQQGINITGVTGIGWDGTGAVTLISSDEAGTRALLDQRGTDYREAELVSAAIEDRPGTLGAAARRLADKGINIEAWCRPACPAHASRSPSRSMMLRPPARRSATSPRWVASRSSEGRGPPARHRGRRSRSPTGRRRPGASSVPGR